MKLLKALGILVVGFVLFIVVVGFLVESDPGPVESGTPSPSVQERPEPAPEPEPEGLRKKDVSIDLRVREQQCFGSAGCNVGVRPEVTVTTDFEGDYEVTYEITGDESGPIIQTLELYEDGTVEGYDSTLSTPSKSAELSARVTHIEELY